MILSARSRIWLRECFWKDYAWQIWDFLLFGIVNSSRKRNIMTFKNSMNNSFVTSSPWYLTRFNSQQNRFKCPKNNAILIPLILEKVPTVGGDTLHPLGCFAPSHGTPITPPPPPPNRKNKSTPMTRRVYVIASGTERRGTCSDRDSRDTIQAWLIPGWLQTRQDNLGCFLVTYWDIGDGQGGKMRPRCLQGFTERRAISKGNRAPGQHLFIWMPDDQNKNTFFIYLINIC